MNNEWLCKMYEKEFFLISIQFNSIQFNPPSLVLERINNNLSNNCGTEVVAIGCPYSFVTKRIGFCNL